MSIKRLLYLSLLAIARAYDDCFSLATANDTYGFNITVSGQNECEFTVNSPLTGLQQAAVELNFTDPFLGVNKYECPPDGSDCQNSPVSSGVVYRYTSQNGVAYQATYVVGNSDTNPASFRAMVWYYDGSSMSGAVALKALITLGVSTAAVLLI